MERCVLKRRLRTVQTSLGSVQVKECEVPAKGDAVHIRCYPEYEACASSAASGAVTTRMPTERF